jgi:hypothetical protein
VRILCVRLAAPCCRAAKEGARAAAECARRWLTSLGSASSRHFLLQIMPKKRDCAKSVRKSRSDLNRL